MKDISEEDVEGLMKELETGGDLETFEKYGLKHLVTGSKDDIDFKTELSEGQINAMAKLLTSHAIIQAQAIFITDEEEGKKKMSNIVPEMNNIIMRLLVSKRRSGRLEFVKAFTGAQSQQETAGILKRFIGGEH